MNVWNLDHGYKFSRRKCPFQLLGKAIVKAKNNYTFTLNSQIKLLQTASYIGLPPFLAYTPNGVTGAEIGLLNAVSSHLGFHYRLRPEKYWLALNKTTGKWEGGMIERVR